MPQLPKFYKTLCIYVCRANEVHRDNLDQVANLDHLDPLEHEENLDNLDLLDNQATEGNQVV